MDLKQYGVQLQTLRKQVGMSQEQLAEALERLARAGPAEDYRVVDSVLISRWEGARSYKGRQWKPTRAYVLYLIRIFIHQLDWESARAWATQAGYQVIAPEFQAQFPDLPSMGTTQERIAKGPRDNDAGSMLPLHNLPIALTSFIGREEEIGVLRQYLLDSESRLVTIVGEGGVGKTRLALAVAQSLLALPVPQHEAAEIENASDADTPDAQNEKQPFPDGIWFIPLAALEPEGAVSIANRLATMIAETISFTSGSGNVDLAAQLIQYLRAKAQLLILDNFEHLMAGTSFLLAFLQQAPQIRILITSRAPLNCQAERLLKLDGLPVAANEARLALDLPSIRLFVERARWQSSDWIQSEHSLHDVNRLCHLVNGNPLALELAAHWVQHFSVAEMVEILLQQDHSLLVTAQQDVPLRHRSMDAVLETSWQLLSPDSQQKLAQLAVLRGTFTREAALAVAGATLNDLSELVERTLLHVEQETSGRRSYIMHELLRQYVSVKLTTLDTVRPGLVETAHRRHSDYYLRFLAERRQALYGNQMKATIAQVQMALDNIRAAWQWAVLNNHMDAVSRVWLGLRTFYHVGSLFQEGEEVFRTAAVHLAAAAARDKEAARLSAELQITQAFFLNLLHRYDEAIAVARTVLTAWQGESDSSVVVRAQLEWGIALSLQSRHNEALTHLTEATHLASRLSLLAEEARARRALYRALLPTGNIRGATAALKQSLAYYRRLGYRLHEGFVLRSLGFVTMLQGEHAKALAYFEEAHAVYQEVDDQARAISIWLHLGEVYDALGDLGRAYHHFQAAYAQREASQDARHAANTIAGFARLLARLGEYEQARSYCQQAIAHQRQLGNQSGVIEALCILGWICQLRDDPSLALVHYQQALTQSREYGAPAYAGAALLGIGKAQAALGHIEAARAACQQALSLHRNLAQKEHLLETLSELARLDLAQGQRVDACVRVDEILAALDTTAPHGVRDLLQIYLTSYQVLKANDDARADQVLLDAYHHLQWRAATIDDDGLRGTFLSNVVANRKIVELYEHTTNLNKAAYEPGSDHHKNPHP